LAAEFARLAPKASIASTDRSTGHQRSDVKDDLRPLRRGGCDAKG
jgi:hypothetical protein